MNNKGSGLTPAQALDKLDALYEQSVVALRNAIGKYITSGELPDENARKQGLFVYPSLTVTWDGSTTNPPKTRAFGRFTHAGSYTTTITRPTLFRSYLNEQLTLLYQDYGAHISVQPSQHEIPYPYVIDGSELTLDRSMSAGLTRYFPTTELAYRYNGATARGKNRRGAHQNAIAGRIPLDDKCRLQFHRRFAPLYRYAS